MPCSLNAIEARGIEDQLVIRVSSLNWFVFLYSRIFGCWMCDLDFQQFRHVVALPLHLWGIISVRWSERKTLPQEGKGDTL